MFIVLVVRAVITTGSPSAELWWTLLLGAGIYGESTDIAFIIPFTAAVSVGLISYTFGLTLALLDTSAGRLDHVLIAGLLIISGISTIGAGDIDNGIAIVSHSAPYAIAMFILARLRGVLYYPCRRGTRVVGKLQIALRESILLVSIVSWFFVDIIRPSKWPFISVSVLGCSALWILAASTSCDAVLRRVAVWSVAITIITFTQIMCAEIIIRVLIAPLKGVVVYPGYIRLILWINAWCVLLVVAICYHDSRTHIHRHDTIV